MKNNYSKFIISIIVINSLFFLLSSILMDTARDLYQAKAITSLSSFPLTGPDIGGFAHVGPIWYYFLAIPTITGSLSLISIWAGFFASLKFIFAYLLGRKILNNNFGILWVLALLLPGWQSIDSLLLLHTNLVQSLTLLLMLLLFQFHHSKNPKYFLYSILTFSLAIHAHPSTLVLGVFIIFSLFVEWKNISIKHMFFAFLIFLLPFLPYIIDQTTNGFSDLDRFLDLKSFYLMRAEIVSKNNSEMSVLQRLPNFLLSLLYYGPKQIHNIIAMNSLIMAKIVFVSYLSILISSILGLVLYSIKKVSHFLVVTKILLVFFVFCLLILSLRSFIPYYMMLVLFPLLAGIIAFGLWNLTTKVKPKYFIILTLVFFIFSTIPRIVISNKYQTSQIEIHNTSEIETKLLDVDVNNMHGLDSLNIINASKFDQTLCEKIFIHGPFSIVLSYTSGFPIDYYCKSHQFRLGGSFEEGQKHILIMHESFWKRSNVNKEGNMFNVFGYTYNFLNHSNTPPLDIIPFSVQDYPPIMKFAKHSEKTYEYTFTTQADSEVLITNILAMSNLTKIKNITINNVKKAELIIYNIGNWMYRCKSCNSYDQQVWKISIETNLQDAIDINELVRGNINVTD